jgi:DNA-binding NarL/FixJ family response regulator
MEKIRVHIADDHKILIDGIKAVLKTENCIEVIGQSLNGIDVLNWFEAGNTCDVLVLDINMPKMDGIEVLRALEEKEITHKTIVLSSYDDMKLVKEVLKMGADGFLAKKCAGEHIVQAIKSVNAGEQYLGQSVQDQLVASIKGVNPSLDNQYLDGIHVSSLTEREKEVLRLISQEMSSIEIADKLCVSKHTILTYRKSLMKKLKVKNVVGLAMYAMKNNMVE